MKLYLFTAEWCSACKAFKQNVLPDFENRYGLEIKIINCDDEKTARLRSQFMVMGGLPTVVIQGVNSFYKVANVFSKEEVEEAIKTVERGDKA